MTTPKYQRAADRIRELITLAEQLAKLERPAPRGGSGSYIQEPVALHSWLVRVDHIVRSDFGADSVHYQHLQEATSRHVEHSHQVERIIGILSGALSDLEGGYLVGQENLIAGAVFDSVLEQAKHLLEAGFKDPAAVLARVVLEDALRRISRDEGLDDNGKASALNEALRDKGRYSKVQWRQVQTWLDIGNAAAHGKFAEYSAADVSRLLEDVGNFWALQIR